MIDHIYYSKCSNKGGVSAGEVNELKLREGRATAALYMDQMSHEANTTAAQIAALQPSMQGSVAGYESTAGGGVLLDEDNPTGDSMQEALVPAGANVGDSSAKTEDHAWPTIGESLADGVDAMRIGCSKGVNPQTVPRLRGFKAPGWAHTESPERKPTPLKGEWTAPTMPDYRKNMLPSQSGLESIIRTDWDFMRFERHGADNNFHCPFAACGYVDSSIQ